MAAAASRTVLLDSVQLTACNSQARSADRIHNTISDKTGAENPWSHTYDCTSICFTIFSGRRFLMRDVTTRGEAVYIYFPAARWALASMQQCYTVRVPLA